LNPGFDMGLDPRNVLAVQLYYSASRDQRAGMSGVLTGTLTAADATSVIELYGEHLPTARDRQKTFELMQLLDEVATRERSEQENRLREQLESQARSKHR
jgi:hypothetical protein